MAAAPILRRRVTLMSPQGVGLAPLGLSWPAKPLAVSFGTLVQLFWQGGLATSACCDLFGGGFHSSSYSGSAFYCGCTSYDYGCGLCSCCAPYFCCASAPRPPRTASALPSPRVFEFSSDLSPCSPAHGAAHLLRHRDQAEGASGPSYVARPPTVRVGA